LCAVLRFNVALIDSRVRFISALNGDRFRVAYKGVKNCCSFVVDDRNTTKDMADVRLHRLAIDRDLFALTLIV
jgi:hypothetical protein